jgi:hypothetical protein
MPLMERSFRAVVLSFLLAIVSAACSDDEGKAPRTALIVEVHTDLEIGDEIDEVRVFARPAGNDSGAGDAGMQGAKGSLDDGELPVNVVLEPAAGVTSVRVVAEGYLDGERVRVQTRRTAFVANEVRVLRMDLASACVMECPQANETCFARGDTARCASDYLDPKYLLRPGERDVDGGGDWDAAVDAGTDADVGDAGACVAEAERCNGTDDDCDTRVDEGSTICPQSTPFAVSACTSEGGEKQCRVIACVASRLDCDDNPDCETRVTADHCGDCETTCDVGDVCAHASGGTGFECLDSNQCPDDTEVCDKVCVDKQTDALHCGECDNECSQEPNATPSCEAGICTLACVEGYGSCNSDQPDDDGCETNILTDPMHCGGCEGANTMCPSRANAETFCDDGICAFRCMDGFLSCNETMTDGCEVPIGEDDCYACGNACNGLLESCCEGQRDCCVL